MNHEERDDLWDLLGRSRPAEVSPFFARDVLRRIRTEQAEPQGLGAWWLSRWALLSAAAAVVILAGAVFWPDAPEAESAASVAILAEVVSSSPDYAVIGNLDELLAAEESSAWLSQNVY